jgi:transportin-1
LPVTYFLSQRELYSIWIFDLRQNKVLNVHWRSEQHPEPPVRQSAYALLGDIAISCFPILKPFLPQIMPDAINAIETVPKAETVSVCNNACWASGEIALQNSTFGNVLVLPPLNAAHSGTETDMGPYVTPLIERLIPILLSPKAARSLTENSAVTIGRLGAVCPTFVAPHLEVFISAWY